MVFTRICWLVVRGLRIGLYYDVLIILWNDYRKIIIQFVVKMNHKRSCALCHVLLSNERSSIRTDNNVS